MPLNFAVFKAGRPEVSVLKWEHTKEEIEIRF